MLLEVRNLSKAYPIATSARDRVRALWRIILRRDDFPRKPVLADIDLTVRRGQSVGIIGENGAGKSTLLKLITGVLTPTTGQVIRQGTVGALLELGAGFQPELSGRDNIVLSAALYGADPALVRARTPEIIEFSGIGAAIDEPVKHYSSGMVVRLGFAIISILKPDLLITDEVLAVGDESFQRQCTRWMEEYLADGGTLLLVSHSLYHIQKLCSHAIWLKDGRIHQQGDPYTVTQAYQAWVEEKRRKSNTRERVVRRDQYSVVRHGLNDSAAAEGIPTGTDVRIQGTLYSPDGREPVVAIGIVRIDGTPVYGTSNQLEGAPLTRVDDRHWAYDVTVTNCPLLPGSYEVTAHAMDPEGIHICDTMAVPLAVTGRLKQMGLTRLTLDWGAPGDRD